MQDKKSFVLYNDYLQHVNLLSDKEAGRLFKAVLSYVNGYEIPELNGAEMMAYSFIKAQIDRDTESYQRRVKANRENGKKGGRPRKDSASATQKNESKKKTETKHKYGEFGHVKLADKDYEALVNQHGEDETKQAIEAVDRYCEETGKTYNNYRLVMQRWGYDSAKRSQKTTSDAVNDELEKIMKEGLT